MDPLGSRGQPRRIVVAHRGIFLRRPADGVRRHRDHDLAAQPARQHDGWRFGRHPPNGGGGVGFEMREVGMSMKYEWRRRWAFPVVAIVAALSLTTTATAQAPAPSAPPVAAAPPESS